MITIKKGLFIALCGLFPTFFLNAQIEKGKSTIGGFANLNFSKNNDLSYSNFQLFPNYGYLINDNLLIGANLPLSAQNNKNNNIGILKSFGVGFTPYAQYFFNPKSKWVGFSELSMGFGTTKGTYNYDSPNKVEFNTSGYSIGVKGGVNRFLNNEISARGTLGYVYNFSKNQFSDFNGHTVTLNISNRNFLKIGNVGNDSLVLTQKNRQMLEFDASLGVFIGDGESDLGLTFNTQYAYFVLKNLALGMNFSYSESNQNKYFNIQPYAQYFFPLTHSLYATAALRVHLYNDGNSSSNYASAQAGLSYFLSQYVMLDCVLVNLNRREGDNQWVFGPSVGVKSFLK